MDRIAMVEKLREKAGVSYEEAKATLEKSDWDLLDAIVLLEQEGKVKEAAFSTKREEPKEEQSNTAEGEESTRGESFDRFLKFLGRIIHKGNTNHMHIMHEGKKKFSLPITIVVLLLIIPPIGGAMLVGGIVSLFFGVRYRFVGPDIGKTGVNKVMDKAANAADAVKEEFKDKDGADNNSEDK